MTLGSKENYINAVATKRETSFHRLDLQTATRKPRRGGREGGAHWGRRFYSGAHADGEETPVKGRESGRSGRRGGRGGAP
jgi:hypothetical protein